VPPIFYGIAAAYLAATLPLSLWAVRKLSRLRSGVYGLLVPFVTALLSYAVALISGIFYGFLSGLWLFLITYPVPLAGMAVFARARYRRYQMLKGAYDAQTRAAKPPVVASLKLRRQLEAFSCSSPLTPEAQREVVILLKNGNSAKEISRFYNTREEELLKIKRAFDSYAREEEKNDRRGEPYTVSPEQREFLLRLMMNATPQSLSCSDLLLWQISSVRRLIQKAAGVYPTEDAVKHFLLEIGALPTEEDYAFSKTREGEIWEKTQYEKIRMSALEKNAAIFWLYALHTKDLPHTVLVAVDPEYPISFGVYKENSGLSDFLSKLSSLTNRPIYAVLCFKSSLFKKFTAPPANVTLFPYGERTDIPE